LALCLRLAQLSPEAFADTMVTSMLSASAPWQAVAGLKTALREFHPVGFRVMSHSSAEADLRDVLPRVDVPTLLLHGDHDVRAPLRVAEALHAAIPASQLVVMPGVGHVSPVEDPAVFTREVRRFLRADRG
jgi:pimeloyl-ACP methyl ester carboxylesterase